MKELRRERGREKVNRATGYKNIMSCLGVMVLTAVTALHASSSKSNSESRSSSTSVQKHMPVLHRFQI